MLSPVNPPREWLYLDIALGTPDTINPDFNFYKYWQKIHKILRQFLWNILTFLSICCTEFCSSVSFLWLNGGDRKTGLQKPINILIRLNYFPIPNKIVERKSLCDSAVKNISDNTIFLQILYLLVMGTLFPIFMEFIIAILKTKLKIFCHSGAWVA